MMRSLFTLLIVLKRKTLPPVSSTLAKAMCTPISTERVMDTSHPSSAAMLVLDNYGTQLNFFPTATMRTGPSLLSQTTVKWRQAATEVTHRKSAQRGWRPADQCCPPTSKPWSTQTAAHVLHAFGLAAPGLSGVAFGAR